MTSDTWQLKEKQCSDSLQFPWYVFPEGISSNPLFFLYLLILKLLLLFLLEMLQETSPAGSHCIKWTSLFFGAKNQSGDFGTQNHWMLTS